MSFDNIPPAQFTLLAYLFGVLFSGNLNQNQQNSLGNFFEALGQSMLTIAAQEQLQQEQQENQQQVCQQIELMKKQLELLERQLKR